MWFCNAHSADPVFPTILKRAGYETKTGLLRQFYMKQWLDTTDKTNTDGMIRLALNKRIRTCEDEKRSIENTQRGGGGGGGGELNNGWLDVFFMYIHVFT